MNYCNIFSYEYVSNNGTCGIQSWKDALIKKGYHWQVIDLKAICHVTNSSSFIIKMSNNNDLYLKFFYSYSNKNEYFLN
jgi:hypothetical protein